MTTRYVGSGGSDSNSGLTWALRKLTLNGVEDTPVVAGDTVYVGPGVYRETLTCDVDGTNGSPITYIGDVTGEHTDGVGGIVRITGSDDDLSMTRSYGVDIHAENYGTFRGFTFDSVEWAFSATSTAGTDWTIEDCTFFSHAGGSGIRLGDASQLNWTIRRCLFFGNALHVYFLGGPISNANHLIENCIFTGIGRGVNSTAIGGVTVKNCTFLSVYTGVRISTALVTGSSSVYVYNCIFSGCSVALQATVAGELVEDYNAISTCTTARNTVNTGANSNTYMALNDVPILLDGSVYPFRFGALSKWSQLDRIAGTSESTDDYFGITRPATSSKKSWGAVQATGAIRGTGTVQAGAASIKLPDAGEQFLMRVPTTAVSTTMSIFCYREADYVGYTGTNPQMIIRQPGQSDRIITDTGSASAWNTLTDTFTPAALPPYVGIFITSSNTSTSGSYSTFFDTFQVS